ncbi:c6 zinc finger domain-containing protein [Ophiostoma piceae UAMH 11346]|uniref:C6 zinc finger domain-containing protein n=1 Tax=Ophiostoma piceae (strain UAMH 11346) TaxID=1262450 RepID=S3BZX6_OPHP1|nr:c6 zinc finger domain-containing protein [Ophiostoma piceae UAMH 11346]
MVGVPGKFKGCETCRLRRVKCDNTRPFCRKCQDTGRECAGYERETVFIIGTVQDGGRCSSHPPRIVKQKKGSSLSGGAGSSGTNNASSSAGGTSRSSPKSSSNSRSASVSRSTPGSSAASSPSIPAIENYPGGPSGIMSSSPFDTASITGGAVVGQRPPNGLHASPGSSDLIAVQPLQSAWNDALPVASGGIVYHVQISALATQLASLVRRRDSSSSSNNNAGAGRHGFALTPFPAYSPFGARSPANKNDNFQLSSQCIVHLASEGSNGSFGHGPTDSICLFLYEHNSPLFSALLPAWKEPSRQHDNIQQSGPSRFVSFPAHHFFSRVYRPSAIWDALINRRATYLSEPEWTSTPWEAHPKSGLDRLLDIACLLPVILGRFDSIAPHEPTMARRMLIQDLLANCLYVERVLEQWYNAVQEMGARGHGGVGGASRMGSAPALRAAGPVGIHNAAATRAAAGGGNWYWIADPDTSAAQIPFADTFAFRDATTALMFVYFWSILVLLYPCIESLHAAAFQPVIDTFPQPYPHLPPSLQIPDPAKYSSKEVRELAANVCRGLDYTLASTVQPDLLTAPLFVVESFYRQINAASGDGALELLWCEAFRGRLAAKGQYLAEVVQTRGWSDAARF